MPDDRTEPDQGLASAEEIVQGPRPDLKDVRFFKMSVELTEEDGPAPTGDLQDDTDSDEENVAIGIGLRTRQSGRDIGVRVDFTATHPDWRVELDVSAEYEAAEDFVASMAGRIDFADQVGIMTLFPYIREAVGNLTQRTTGTSYILPTIERGQISFRNEFGS